MKPRHAPAAFTEHYVARALGGCRSVLEAGCGRGWLAAGLARRGFEVTAIDRDLADLEATGAPGLHFAEADFLSFEGGPYDAVVFVASLHHLSPLAAAVDRLRRLVAPDGRVVLDEFDVAAPDEATARWHYQRQEELARLGLYSRERIFQGEEAALARWHAEHQEAPPLHTGPEMLFALGEAFPRIDVRRGLYLFRYLCAGLPETPAGSAAAVRVIRSERNGIRSGALRPVGLRAIAHRGRTGQEL